MHAIGQCTGVVAGSVAIAGKSPFPVFGIEPDNEGVFIHDAHNQFGADRGIEFIVPGRAGRTTRNLAGKYVLERVI